MIFSFAALLSTLLLSSTIAFLQILFVKKLRINRLLSGSFLMIISIIFIVRLFLPVEFFFTKTLPSNVILPYLDSLLCREFFVLGSFSINLKHILIMIWLTGCFFCLTRFCFSLHKISLIKRLLSNYPSFKHNNKKIIKINEPISPVVIGFFFPIILLPNLDLSDKETKYILDHELFHISNYDVWIKYAYEFLSIIYWWNPVVYIFKNSFNQIIELKADESVVSQLNDQERIEYVETLLKVGAQINRNYFRKELESLTSFTSYKQKFLLERAENIFSEKKSKPPKLVAVFFAICCFYFSSCVIFESFVADPEVESSTISISKKDSFLIKTGENKYKVYNQGAFLFEVSNEDRKKQFQNLKIFNSIKEGEKYVKKNN